MRAATRLLCGLMLALGGAATAQEHSADTNHNDHISLSELLRVIQLHNAGTFHCADVVTEDGFDLGAGDTACAPHSSDYAPQDWNLGLSEMVRMAQLFNSGGFHACSKAVSEDGFCLDSLPAEPDEFVYVREGSFEMGAPSTDTPNPNELPVHSVSLDAYAIGRFEVTNQQMVNVLNWANARGFLESAIEGGAFTGGTVYAHGQPLLDTYPASLYSAIGYNGTQFSVLTRAGSGGSNYSMADHPVVQVSWFGCVAYCNWRSEKEGLLPCYDFSDWSRYSPVRNGYRLPTEAEWERAAAWDGSRHWRYGFTSDTISASQANYSSSTYVNPLGLTANPYTSPVGWFDGAHISPNGNLQTLDSRSPVGCYDMSGNVWEWCHDWYASGYYATSPGSNPEGSDTGPFRVVRGGAWYFFDFVARTAFRDLNSPGNRYQFIGMRIARTP